jgi:hypothetical protein
MKQNHRDNGDTACDIDDGPAAVLPGSWVGKCGAHCFLAPFSLKEKVSPKATDEVLVVAVNGAMTEPK